MAHVVDLEIIPGEYGDLFQFRWEGDGWHEALDEVKDRIPPEAREFKQEEKVWRVPVCFEDELSDIFPNFAGELDAIRSQVRG